MASRAARLARTMRRMKPPGRALLLAHREGRNQGRGGRLRQRSHGFDRWAVPGFRLRSIRATNRVMFVTFFHELKAAGVPVTLREYLTLMEAMEADLAGRRVEDFYFLSRAALVKDERNIDKFDRVFGHVFKGLETIDGVIEADIPAEWLKKLAERYLTEEEKKQIEAMGGLDKLLETLRQRLAEQKKRHQGGSKWIGTAGTSPYGAYGYNPEGVRIGQDENRNFRAVKVWDKREFKDLDDEVEIGTRNIKLALRRLRKFARTGAPEELDLDGTIKGTAHKGYLDILMRPERHNA